MPFQSGISGNPAGRPKATGSRQQIFNALVEPHREALFNKAIEMALYGNESMLRLFLDRLLPAKPTDEPVRLDMEAGIGESNNIQAMYRLGLETLRAVIVGEITPTEAEKVSGLANVHSKLFGLLELNERINLLEQRK